MEKITYSRWTYCKHAIIHPWHVVVLVGATVFGVANWSILILLAVFFSMEFIMLAVLLNLKAFREYVEERMAQLARCKAAEIRASILLQLRNNEIQEVVSIEKKIDNLRNRFANFPAASTLAVGECQELLGQYIKLGIQLNLMSGTDGTVSTHTLETHIRDLKKVQEKSDIIEQRVAIAEQRLKLFEASRVERTAMMNRLSAIHEMICLKTEASVMPSPIGNLTNLKIRVDDTNITNELMEYAHIEDIDLDAIQLGRLST